MPCLQETGCGPLLRGTTRILQLNVGLYCNQVGGLRCAAATLSCKHVGTRLYCKQAVSQPRCTARRWGPGCTANRAHGNHAAMQAGGDWVVLQQAARQPCCNARRWGTGLWLHCNANGSPASGTMHFIGSTGVNTRQSAALVTAPAYSPTPPPAQANRMVS
jgi:hypothetical protein